MVDKLWQGMFNKDSKLVVDFIVQLIGQVEMIFPSRCVKINLYFHAYVQHSASLTCNRFLKTILVNLPGGKNDMKPTNIFKELMSGCVPGFLLVLLIASLNNHFGRSLPEQPEANRWHLCAAWVTLRFKMVRH